MIINCTYPSIQGILNWTTAGVSIRPGFIWILANDLEEGVISPLMTLELPSFWGLQSSAWNENNAHRFNFLLLQFCSLKQYEFFYLAVVQVWSLTKVTLDSSQAVDRAPSGGSVEGPVSLTFQASTILLVFISTRKGASSPSPTTINLWFFAAR